MKKLLLFVTLLAAINVSFARTADLFSYDNARVQKALVNADALDHYVSQAMVSLDKIDLSNPVTANFFARSGNTMMDEPALGIGGFWWGLILGWVGILIVYLVTEDSEETKKALYGCIVQGVVGLACYVLYVALIVGTWSAMASEASAY